MNAVDDEITTIHLSGAQLQILYDLIDREIQAGEISDQRITIRDEIANGICDIAESRSEGSGA